MSTALATPRREIAARNKLVELAPIVEPSPPQVPRTTRMKRGKRRYIGLTLSFILCVLIPIAATVWYLSERAADQYASSAAFAIRTEEASLGLDLLSGFAAMSGSSSSDIDILDRFLISQDLVTKIQSKLNLRKVWSKPRNADPVFSFDPDGTIEDLTTFWQRMVRVDYDSSSGLIEVEAKAFSEVEARQITQAILAESTHLMNHLSDGAHQSIIKSATEEYERAKSRLRDVRLAVSALRAKTGMMDPEAGLSGDHGVVQSLQESLANELVKLDLLRSNLGESGQQARNANDIRIEQNEIKIDVLRSRIAQERQKFDANDGAGYSEIIAKFEELLVEQRFAEEAYVATTAALDAARAEARRSSRYLAVFVQPTEAERALYPRRVLISVLVGMFTLLLWGLLALVYYSVRDRRPV
ncbi:hypothetical protein [Litoreibacter janthinus]|uniref:Capsular polysaccharide transport system permease protein n=1 Tax=Litoreibacter janthinus TaxID=670154 RepID=A0A1I6ID15_9RHOB|nr:hypothetical protein [Litoreibacter janthinus]SFR64514.1 capsular polysaccharide transport system permease protein [Litoreibacter janthinus]